MTLVRWDPFRDLMNLHQRLSAPLGNGDAYGSWVPPVDIFERGDELVIRAEVPGVEKDAIDVSVEDQRLTIRGERSRENDFEEENAYRLERSYGSFTRSFVLPKTVDPAGINASYRNGELEIRLPKAEVAKPRKVAIHS